eukprot:scaffold3538_cov105-Isochrysis_galbana.AAC.3
MTHDAGAVCDGAPLRLAAGEGYPGEGKGSARRGGRGGHGGGIAAAAGMARRKPKKILNRKRWPIGGRQPWRRGDVETGTASVAVWR